MIKRLKKIFLSKVAQNGVWLLLLQGFNTIVPLLTIPYITRILSTTAFGEFSIALNWVGYLQVIVEYGFALSGAKKVATAKTQSEYSVVHSNIFFARFLLLLISIILFVVVGVLFVSSKTQLVCMILLFLMVIAIVFQQTWFYQGILEMKSMVLISVAGRLLSLVLIFLFVKSADDVYLYSLFYSINILVSNIIAFIIVKLKYHVRLKFVTLRNIGSEIKDGFPLFLSSAMTRIFGSIGITFLGFFVTAEVVGAYSAINKIPYVLTLTFAAVGQALYPQSCKNFSISFQNGLKSIKKISAPVLLFFGGCVIVLSLFHADVVRIAFGVDYVMYSSLLLPFVFWVFAGIVNNFLGIQILVASGHQKEYSKNITYSTIFMVVLMLVLGYLFKEQGIAVASLCSELMLSVLLAKDIYKIRKNA